MTNTNETQSSNETGVDTPASVNSENRAVLSISFNSAQIVNLIMAALGAGAVYGIFRLLEHVAMLFAAAVPFIFGGILFATLVSAFFLLLNLQKTMRRRASLRLSFGEAYTAVSVFVIMGYFATACMHAFMGDGLALAHWTHGVTATALVVTGFGLGKGIVSLWNEGKKA